MCQKLMLGLAFTATRFASPLSAQEHFDPKGKLPSQITISLLNQLRGELPFEDRRDCDDASRGFIAAPEYKQIMADAGNVA